MNQIKLSLRAADDPRSIKEEAGLPTFASVFALHNAANHARGDKEAIPITVKAFNELAVTTVAELKKGVAFVVEGRLAYYRNPVTNREAYSILADRFIDITPPKTAVKPV
jgi:single-stranded DNA-binding protein